MQVSNNIDVQSLHCQLPEQCTLEWYKRQRLASDILQVQWDTKVAQEGQYIQLYLLAVFIFTTDYLHTHPTYM